MPNLNTGTKNMAGRLKKISLSAEDICKIIAECRSASVAEFNYESIRIVFQYQRNDTAPILGQGRDSVFDYTINANLETEEAKLVNEQTLLDAEDAQVLIEDPLAFEKMNTSMDLERNRAIDTWT